MCTLKGRDNAVVHKVLLGIQQWISYLIVRASAIIITFGYRGMSSFVAVKNSVFMVDENCAFLAVAK